MNTLTLPEVNPNLILQVIGLLDDIKLLTGEDARAALELLREVEVQFPVITLDQFQLVQRVFAREPNGLNWYNMVFYMYVWQQQVYKAREKAIYGDEGATVKPTPSATPRRLTSGGFTPRSRFADKGNGGGM